MSTGSYEVGRCSGCGLLITQPLPSLQELRAIYDSGAYYSTEEASSAGKPGEGLLGRMRRAARDSVVRRHYGRATGGSGRIDVLWSALARRRFGWAPSPLSGESLLDIGCGDGSFLLAARGAGWQAAGLEISERAARNAALLGLEVAVGYLEDRLYDAESFDVIRAWSVLEHMLDPPRAMAEVTRLLRPGGWAIVQVPNAAGFVPRLLGRRWSGWDVPLHLHHFTAKTLRRLAGQAGLEPVELHHTSVGTLTGSVSMLRSPPGRALVFLLDQVLDFAGLGDCIMMFACKRADRPDHHSDS